MRIQVKLFSVLRQCVPNYEPDLGVFVELPAHATVQDLLAMLNIPEKKKPVVTCDGRVLKRDTAVKEGSILHVFQPVAGG
jgi:sulfur carrier protein ThiS